jgi:membrane protease YdiL (CAAX protease family)
VTVTASTGRRRGAAYRVGATVVVLISAVVASGFAYGLVSAAGAGTTTAGTIASAAMALGILVFGLQVATTLSPAEQRLMVGPRCTWPVTLGVAFGVALAARIGIGILTDLGQRFDSGLCHRLNDLSLEPTPQLWQKIALALTLVVVAPLGASHLQYYATWPVLIGVALFGVANAYVYRRFGYRTAVATHALFNLAAAIFLFIDLPELDVQCPT